MERLTITLEDGRTFPQYNGETLCWSTGLYHTAIEAKQDFPRMRAVLRAMIQDRPAQVIAERRELVRDSFNAMFGHNAKAALAVVEAEMLSAGLQDVDIFGRLF